MRRNVAGRDPRILEAFIEWVMAVVETWKPNSFVGFVSTALDCRVFFAIAVWNTLAAYA